MSADLASADFLSPVLAFVVSAFGSEDFGVALAVARVVLPVADFSETADFSESVDVAPWAASLACATGASWESDASVSPPPLAAAMSFGFSPDATASTSAGGGP